MNKILRTNFEIKNLSINVKLRDAKKWNSLLIKNNMSSESFFELLLEVYDTHCEVEKIGKKYNENNKNFLKVLLEVYKKHLETQKMAKYLEKIHKEHLKEKIKKEVKKEVKIKKNKSKQAI